MGAEAPPTKARAAAKTYSASGASVR
ncbi:hypothetical protein [Lysobacter enzymogenes]